MVQAPSSRSPRQCTGYGTTDAVISYSLKALLIRAGGCKNTKVDFFE